MLSKDMAHAGQKGWIDTEWSSRGSFPKNTHSLEPLFGHSVTAGSMTVNTQSPISVFDHYPIQAVSQVPKKTLSLA